MKKTKFALVSLLCLLVTSTFVFTVIAEENEFSTHQSQQSEITKTLNNSIDSTFRKIKMIGGESVSKKVLKEKRGESALLAATMVAAYGATEVVEGAFEAVASYETENRLDPDSEPTNLGRAASAMSGAVSGPIPGPGSSAVIGSVVGEAVENGVQHGNKIRESVKRTAHTVKRGVEKTAHAVKEKVTFWND